MTTSEYPKTFTREADGASVQVSTRADEVKAKFDGYREDVDASDSSDAYEVDEVDVRPTRVSPNNVFGNRRGDAS